MVCRQNSLKFILIQSHLILGAAGEYQTLLQQVTLPYVDHDKCETLLRATRLGERFGLGESFNCAGGKFQISINLHYGNTGCEVFKRGVERKIFCKWINIPYCYLRLF